MGEEIELESVIVLFEGTLREGKMEDYLAQAAALKDALAQAQGFLRSERFSSLSAPNKLLSMSVWDSEESAAKWRNQMDHRLCQKHGRIVDFADYKITVVAPLRFYTMTERKDAPADSNQYWEGYYAVHCTL